MKKIFITFIAVFLIASCGKIKTTDVSAAERLGPVYTYTMDVSTLTPVPQSIHGAHHGGLMGSVDFDGDAASIAAVNISNEIHWNVARFPGGGHLKFMHLLDPKGYGYRLNEIQDYFNAGGEDEDGEGIADWTQTYNQQQLITYRYIDRYVDYYNSLAAKPKIIMGMNVTTGTVSEQMAILDFLIAHGVQVAAVEMGNEAYSQFASWSLYWAKVNPFLVAIKSAHPEIMRSVVIAPFSGRNIHIQWNNGLNAQLLLSDLIQAGVPHLYPGFSVACQDMYNAYVSPKKNFQIQYDTKDAIVGPIADCFNMDFQRMASTDIQDWRTNLDTTFPGLKLLVTEWNYLPVNMMANTLAESFYSFKAVLELQKNPNIVWATNHNFVAPAGHGMVTTPLNYDSLTLDLHKRAKYYAFYAHSKAQNGFSEAGLSLPFAGITYKAYYKEGNSLIIGINESSSSYAFDSFGIDGYSTLGCNISGIDGRQLYSSAGQTDYIAKNNFYKNNVAAASYEITGLKNYASIPAMSVFIIECTHEKVLPPPPPPVSKPWYCKFLPKLKECRN